MGHAVRHAGGTTTDAVLGRLDAALAGPATAPPLARALLAVVPHLHAVIRELRPSRAEWRRTLDFLAEVGQISDARRHEWVLLSDVLGASALVDELNAPRHPAATPNGPRGPFYRAGAPALADGADVCLDGRGEPLTVSLALVDLDGDPVAGARVETWQANPEGTFENQAPDEQPEWNLRGTFTSDAAGRVRYRTVRPGGCRLPGDGPVGRLLGELGHPLARPAHLMYRVEAAGFDTLVAPLYDGSDPDLHADPLPGLRPELVAALVPAAGANGPPRGRSAGAEAPPSWSLEHTFVLARAR